MKIALPFTALGLFIGALVVFIWMDPHPKVTQRCKAACNQLGHDRWVLDDYKGCICTDRKAVWSKPSEHPRMNRKSQRLR